MIDIEMDRKLYNRVRRFLDSSYHQAVEKATVRSLNTTLTAARTEATKLIGQNVALPARRIKQNFKIDKAKSTNLTGSLTAHQSPVGLHEYGARQLWKRQNGEKTPAGVSVKMHRGVRRQKIKQAFFVGKTLEQLKSGETGPLAMRTSSDRYPLDILYGPSVRDVFYNVRQDMTPDVKKALQRRFLNDLAFYLRKLKS